MNRIEIKGIIPPIITPMHADESINTAELRRRWTARSKTACMRCSALAPTARDIFWTAGKTARAGDGH